MKKLLFAITIIFALATVAQAQLAISGSTNITANGTAYWYQLTGGNSTAYMEVDMATATYTGGDGQATGFWITPITGGSIRLKGEQLSPVKLTFLNIIVKPVCTVEGNSNLYLVDYGPPRGTFVIGTFTLEGYNGVIQDSEWDLSGPSSYSVIYEDINEARYVFKSSGMNSLKGRVKQNGVWSNWFTRIVWVSNPQ